MLKFYLWWERIATDDEVRGKKKFFLSLTIMPCRQDNYHVAKLLQSLAGALFSNPIFIFRPCYLSNIEISFSVLNDIIMNACFSPIRRCVIH